MKGLQKALPAAGRPIAAQHASAGTVRLEDGQSREGRPAVAKGTGRRMGAPVKVPVGVYGTCEKQGAWEAREYGRRAVAAGRGSRWIMHSAGRG